MLDLEEIVDLGYFVEELKYEDYQGEDVEWNDNLNDERLHLCIPPILRSSKFLQNQPKYLYDNKQKDCTDDNQRPESLLKRVIKYDLPEVSVVSK